jgi:hypothetical protein
MARIIEGDTATFNALVYGQVHPGTQQFLYQQYESPTAILTEAGARFVEYGREIHQRLADSRASQFVSAVQRAVGSIWQPNSIRLLESIGDFQWAPHSMQRVVMANPVVRQMYTQQRVEGYEGSYIDAYPGTIRDNHYDYQRVMNGLVVFNEKDDWSATTYFEELEENDNELNLFEQTDVVDSWKHLEALLKQGKDDPTSRWNSSL